MSMFPKRHQVLVSKRSESGKDAHGNPVESWGPPEPHMVYGWAVPSADEVIREAQTGVKRDLDIYADEPLTGHRDKVTVSGSEFMAQGDPRDFNHGPFGFTPGYVIVLEKVDG